MSPFHKPPVFNSWKHQVFIFMSLEIPNIQHIVKCSLISDSKLCIKKYFFIGHLIEYVVHFESTPQGNLIIKEVTNTRHTNKHMLH